MCGVFFHITTEQLGYQAFPKELSELCAGLTHAGSHTFTSASAPIQYAAAAVRKCLGDHLPIGVSIQPDLTVSGGVDCLHCMLRGTCPNLV